MCGIVGFNWADKVLIKKMVKEIWHRGPDDCGAYIDNNFSLGHARLSIVDLSKKGHQPMFNEDKTVVLVFNGEIYNFKKIREDLKKKGHKFVSNTDSEVIIHGYEEYGEKVLSLLKGMFAFCILDIKNKKILLARDRIGIKPLYYYFNKGKLIFASEIKAILLDDSIKREVNKQCLSDYLTLRYSSREETMFKGIKKLEPGKYIVYKNGCIKIENYWKFPEFTNDLTPDPKLLDKLIEFSVQKRLMADVPIGVFLSGGLDSSTIVAYLSRLTRDIRTFSIGFDDPTDEVKYAKIVANRFNTQHTEIISDKNILSYLPEVVKHMDEPMADPASLPTYVLSKEVSKKVKVVLAGEGGDEVFGGYDDLNYINKLKLIMKTPKLIRKNIIAKPPRIISPLFKYPRKQILKLSSEILESSDIKEAYKKMMYFPFDKKDKQKLFSKNLSNQLKTSTVFDYHIDKDSDLKKGAFSYYFREWLPNDVLLKADKMGLANALEIRVPFLDIDIVNYSCGLDNKYKQDRYLFRKTISKMLPKIILNKKKQGFTLPISNWFCKKEFVSNIQEHFEDLSKRKFFNEYVYKKIINNPSGFKNDHKMWVLLNFELWCKIYLDNINYKTISI